MSGFTVERGVVRLLVEYDGSGYQGWQRQSHGTSVQTALEEALGKVADAPVQVAVAGRTDAGVHASAQVVSFVPPANCGKRDCEAWKNGGNRYLPEDILILRAESVAADFHARFSARSRRYLYLMSEQVPARGLNARRFWHVGKPLAVQRMHSALQALLGEHDFSAFRSSTCQSRTPMRHMLQARVTRVGELVLCDLEANAFLHRMVRMILGVLVPLGVGKVPESALSDALRCGSFDASRMPTAPAHGLYLCGVAYADGTCFRLPTPLLGSDYA